MSVLLLNASYEPLRVVSMKRAVALLLEEKATVIAESDARVRSAELDMASPSVIKLNYFVQIPFKSRVPLNRKTLMARDNGECQYEGCTRVGNTIDHVIPRSKGGQHEWTNTVACCHRHNQQKGDLLLERDKRLAKPGEKTLDWKLKREPVAPTGTKWLVLGLLAKDNSDEWAEYLEPSPAVA